MRLKNKKVVYLLGGVLLAILTASSVFAQEDVPGSKDHPLLTRMPNFYISDYEEKDFDQADFKNSKGGDIKVEGHILDIFYELKEGAKSPGKLQVLRNYENAIKKIGGSVVYEAGKQAWLKVERGGKITWIYVDARTGGEYELKIIEKKAMTQEVIADAKSLARDISSTGHTSVYGIYFDFNSAKIKPESEKAIKEIAKLLEGDLSLKLYVVGHTDNVGKISYNMKLSRARAESVMNELITKYKVSANQLKAYGVGSLAPVASNKTEEGRTKNRRVELVEQ